MGGSKCKLTRVVLVSHLPEEFSIAIFAGPGSALGFANTTRPSGDAARTKARSALSVPRFASTCSRKCPPQTENWSTSETTGETISAFFSTEGSAASTKAAALLPEPFAIITFTPEGVVKFARPVLSVFTRSVSPSTTVIPSARRPSTPRTASVAILPATSFGGRTIETAQVVEEFDCARAGAGIRTTLAIHAMNKTNAALFTIRGLAWLTDKPKKLGVIYLETGAITRS